jgi:hypothetical protein
MLWSGGGGGGGGGRLELSRQVHKQDLRIKNLRCVSEEWLYHMETGDQGAENTVIIHENTVVVIQENTVIIHENTVVVIQENTVIT